jgi:hypothetical protein
VGAAEQSRSLEGAEEKRQHMLTAGGFVPKTANKHPAFRVSHSPFRLNQSIDRFKRVLLAPTAGTAVNTVAY